MFLGEKLFNRIKPVLGNAVFLSLPGLSNILNSFLIIRFYQTAWWGNIVELQIIYYVVTTFTIWGNKEFLLREFSKSPSQLKNIWSESFNTRSVLLVIPALLFVLLFIHLQGVMYLIIWIFLRHIQQSFESIASFEKKFIPLMISELAVLTSSVMICIFNKDLIFEDILFLITLGYFLRTMISSFFYRKFFARGFSINMIKSSMGFMLLGFTGVVQTKTDAMAVNLLLDKIELAKYGIVTSLILMGASAASFIIYPYAKNVFRISKDGLKNFIKQFYQIGILISLSVILLEFAVIKYFYHIDFSITVYFISFVCIMPVFWYTPVAFYFFGENKITKVILINSSGIVINAIASFLLIKPFGIEGALCSMALSQIGMLIWFYVDFYQSMKNEY